MPTDSDVMKYELELLDEAMRGGHHYIGDRRLSEIELFARLQHHGAATRLLDFTESMFVALWFACRDDLDSTGVLIGLTNIVPWRGLSRSGHGWKALWDKIGTKEGTQLAVPYVFRPSIVSSRIAAQHGLFLMSAVQPKKWGSVPLPAGDYGRKIILVSSELKKRLQPIWKSLFGFTHDRMFPDIDGFGAHHHWQRLWGGRGGYRWMDQHNKGQRNDNNF